MGVCFVTVKQTKFSCDLIIIRGSGVVGAQESTGSSCSQTILKRRQSPGNFGCSMPATGGSAFILSLEDTVCTNR